MALCFTNHTISGGSTSRFLRAFDKEYKDEGVKGGDLKKGFLLGHDIPCLVKFNCWPHLDKLIRELTEASTVCYEEPPTADHVQGLKQVWANNVDPSIMRLLPAFNYQQCLNDLAAPNWLVNMFRRNLNANFWPSSDKCREQPIGTGSSKKQAREQDKLVVWIPGTESQRHSNSSGLCSGLWVPSDDGQEN